MQRIAKSLLVLLALVVSACNSNDGRQLRAPARPATTQVPTAIATTLPVATGSLTISSPNFVDQGILPDAFTSKGVGISPQLDWFNVPEGAAELALVVTDTTTGGTVHWILWGLDPSRTQLLAAEVPVGAKQSSNYLGTIGWSPPAPPGNGAHTYLFEIHAIAGGIFAPDGASPNEVLGEIFESSMAVARIAGLAE